MDPPPAPRLSGQGLTWPPTPTAPTTGRPSCSSTAAARPATPGAAPPACSATRAGGRPPSTCGATATATGPPSDGELQPRRLRRRRPGRGAPRSRRPPALVGASLGGLSSLVAIAEAPAGDHGGPGLVLVDVAPRLEQEGIDRIADFMLGHLDGFADLETVADAVAAYNPHRPDRRTCPACARTSASATTAAGTGTGTRSSSAGGRIDEPRACATRTGSRRPPGPLTVPTLLVRGRQSDVLSEEGARHCCASCPTPGTSTSAAPATWWRATATTPSTTPSSSSCRNELPI